MSNHIVHIGENSPEQVAYKMMKDIANAEQVSLVPNGPADWKRADRAWILQTFAVCLDAVRNPNAHL
jgi:hypothetical protein